MLVALCAVAASQALAEPRVYDAADSLAPVPGHDAAAKQTLDLLTWTPTRFDVRVTAAGEDAFTDADAFVRFASPKPVGDSEAVYNKVFMEWRRPSEQATGGKPAPAVIVLHILDGRMTVARAFARTLTHQYGMHTFVVHLPGYGQRRGEKSWRDVSQFFPRVQQAASDVRRAYDAVAALPGVDTNRISLQGTSLGSFIASLAAGLDGAFDHTFLMLSGAEMYKMFHNGEREALWIRLKLREAGIDDDELRRRCDLLDPGNLAPRFDPRRTWLFSAQYDQVVPSANARALARAGKLEGDHHRWMLGDHYSVALHLPWAIQTVANTIKNHTP